jgi:hypothetical protein
MHAVRPLGTELSAPIAAASYPRCLNLDARNFKNQKLRDLEPHAIPPRLHVGGVTLARAPLPLGG